MLCCLLRVDYSGVILYRIVGLWARGLFGLVDPSSCCCVARQRKQARHCTFLESILSLLLRGDVNSEDSPMVRVPIDITVDIIYSYFKIACDFLA